MTAGLRPIELHTPEQRLFAEPTGYHFDQVAFLLELLLDRGGRGRAELEQLVRFKTFPSLNFPASSVRLLRRRLQALDKPHVFVNFFGLIGPQGALPLHYTLKVLEDNRRVPADDLATSPLLEWLDLFNHRLIGQFYRAWEKYRFPVTFFHYARRAFPAGGGGRPGRGATDDFSQALLCLVGLGVPGVRQRLVIEASDPLGLEPPRQLAEVPDLMLLHFGGNLARRQRHLHGLIALLNGYFGLPVEVQDFAGQWLLLPPANQSQLEEVGNCALGENVVAGDRIWDFNSLFRIRLGPLDYDAFVRFLPDPCPNTSRKAFFLLSQLTRLYAGPEFDFDVELRLRGDQVPECAMIEPAPGDLGPRLGWNTWLKCDVMPDVVDGAVFPGDDRTRV